MRHRTLVFDYIRTEHGTYLLELCPPWIAHRTDAYEIDQYDHVAFSACGFIVVVDHPIAEINKTYKSRTKGIAQVILDKKSQSPNYDVKKQFRFVNNNSKNFADLLNLLFMLYTPPELAELLLIIPNVIPTRNKQTDLGDRLTFAIRNQVRKYRDIVLPSYYSTLEHALCHDKVLMWLFLRKHHPEIVLPKCLLKVTNYNSDFRSPFQQKIQALLTQSPWAEAYVLKPTSSSMAHGVLVVPKDKINAVFKFIYEKKSMLGERRLDVHNDKPLLKDFAFEFLKLIYGENQNILQDEIVLMYVLGFVTFCFSDYGDDAYKNDYILLEPFAQPLAQAYQDYPKQLAVAKRGFAFARDDRVNVQIVERKPLIKPDSHAFKTIGYAPYRHISTAQNDINILLFQANSDEFLSHYSAEGDPSLEEDKIRLNSILADEPALLQGLFTIELKDFLTEIQHLNADDSDIIDYLGSQSVSKLAELDELDFCWHCGKTGVNMPHCGKCNIATYCSRECQVANWQSHKPQCKQLRSDKLK